MRRPQRCATVDAIALATEASAEGHALLLADATGVGKGRTLVGFAMNSCEFTATATAITATVAAGGSPGA